jgi:hypothetical protein
MMCRNKLGCFTLAFVAIMLLSSCVIEKTRIEEAVEIVKPDMTREQAIELLAPEAWYHQPCQLKVTLNDLFFYDSRDYDKAYLVIVSSQLQDNRHEVTGVSTLEPYAWHTAYSQCIEREKFAN